ncbi:MFS transporter [Anaerotignum sp.]
MGYSRDIWLILIASFFYASSATAVLPLIAGFSESLGATAVMMGMIGGMMNFCSLFCRPVAGNLSDKVSKYKLSLIGAVIMLAGCLGCAVALNPIMVAVARLVTGVGFALCSVCMSTWMSDMLPKNKIGSGMGVYGMANALANAVAPSISLTVWEHFGYRASLLLTAVYAAITVALISLVKNKGVPSPAVQESGSAKNQIIEWKIFPVACIMMLVAIPYFATQSFLVSYVSTKQLDISINLFFPVYAIVLLALRFFMKDYFDKLPFRVLITGSALCGAVGILLLTVMQNTIMLLCAAACMAGGYGLTTSICQSAAIMMAGEGRRGIANSTFYVGLDLGMMLGPVIGGFLYGNVPIGLFYPVLLLTVPVALIIAWATGKSARAKKAKTRPVLTLQDTEVAHLMKTDVYAVNETASVLDALKLITDRKISGAPVVDQDGILKGFVSIDDILSFLAKEHTLFINVYSLVELNFDEKLQELLKSNIKEVATEKVFTVDLEDPLEEICYILSKYRIKKAPVMHEGKMVGIINASTIIKYILNRNITESA